MARFCGQRLAVGFMMLALLLPALRHSARLWAQGQTSPEETSKWFMTYLGLIRRGSSSSSEWRAIHQQALRKLVSAKSAGQLEEQGVLSLLEVMQEQASTPSWTAQTSPGNDDKNATVRVTPDLSKPVVCVREGPLWRVDLTATYAQWNQITDTQVLKVIQEAAQQANRTRCQSYLKQLSLAFMQYCQDNDEQFPAADKWYDALLPYTRTADVFTCPEVAPGKYGYAMNAKLSRRSLAALESPAETVLIYETTVLKRNYFGEGKDLAFRHLGGANYAHSDGHVKWYPSGRTQRFSLTAPSLNERLLR